jgi:hypothetical protein
MAHYTITLNKETLEQLRIALQVAMLVGEIPKDFDEEYYLEANDDVRAAVEDRLFRSGYEHYLSLGRYQGRPCNRPSSL